MSKVGLTNFYLELLYAALCSTSDANHEGVAQSLSHLANHNCCMLSNKLLLLEEIDILLQYVLAKLAPGVPAGVTSKSSTVISLSLLQTTEEQARF